MHFTKVFRGLLEILGVRKAFFYIFITLVFWLFIAVSERSSIDLEHFFIDLMHRVKMDLLEPHSSLIGVDIDTNSLKQIPFRWPWPRSVMANLIKKIQSGKPKLILIDVLFQQSELSDSGAGDNQFSQEIKKAQNVGLISMVEQTYGTFGTSRQIFRNCPIIRNSAKFEGFVWNIVDDTGCIRLFICSDNKLGEDSCVLKAAKFLDPTIETPAQDNFSQSKSFIAYAKRKGGIPHVSVQDILGDNIDFSVFLGKVVIIGPTAMILHDHFRTPCGFLFGQEIFLSSLDTLIQKRVVVPRLEVKYRFISALLGGLISIFILYYREKSRYRWSFLLLVCLVVFAMGSPHFSGIYLPVAPFTISWLFLTFIFFGCEAFLEFMHLQFNRAEGKATAEIQNSFFPKNEWSEGEYLCRGKCIPCEAVGGDYFDFFPFRDGSFAFLIGDVSGHGFSAAMVTTMAKTTVTLLTHDDKISPEILAEKLNQVIFDLQNKRRFMTSMIGFLDVSTAKGRIISAGHIPGFIISKDGSLREIGKPSFPLGIRKKFMYSQSEIYLDPGEHLLLYTDGIIEARNWAEQQYGFDRWKKFLSSRLPHLRGEEGLEPLLKDLRDFCQGRAFLDDVTLVLLSRASKSRDR